MTCVCGFAGCLADPDDPVNKEIGERMTAILMDPNYKPSTEWKPTLIYLEPGDAVRLPPDA